VLPNSLILIVIHTRVGSNAPLTLGLVIPEPNATYTSVEGLMVLRSMNRQVLPSTLRVPYGVVCTNIDPFRFTSRRG
jgi:hypothetical protein